MAACRRREHRDAERVRNLRLDAQVGWAAAVSMAQDAEYPASGLPCSPIERLKGTTIIRCPDALGGQQPPPKRTAVGGFNLHTLLRFLEPPPCLKTPRIRRSRLGIEALCLPCPQPRHHGTLGARVQGEIEKGATGNARSAHTSCGKRPENRNQHVCPNAFQSCAYRA